MKTPLTRAGYNQLTNNLHRLTTVEKHLLLSAIEEARKHGDLKENAEYHSARELYKQLNQRIYELHQVLQNSYIVDPAKFAEKTSVIFGATVYLKDQEDKNCVFQLVGEPEANLDNHKLSIASPLGQALINKSVGDHVILEMPTKTIKYVIINLEYK